MRPPPSRALSEAVVVGVLTARREQELGPHPLGPGLGLARSTVCAHGLSRLSTPDRTTAAPIHYVRSRPGELIRLDVKQLGRIPPVAVTDSSAERVRAYGRLVGMKEAMGVGSSLRR